jgi:hypothetical protein
MVPKTHMTLFTVRTPLVNEDQKLTPIQSCGIGKRNAMFRLIHFVLSRVKQKVHNKA